MQTVVRAEIMGVLAGLRAALWVHLYVDCLHVVQTLLQLLDGVLPNFDFICNGDLWCLISNELERRPAEAVLITKVKAHTEASEDIDMYSTWTRCHNANVDTAAKDANCCRCPVFKLRHQDRCNKEDDYRKQVKAIQLYIV
ncbi:unnamed protein product, partial [Polarella glacialis]